MTAVSVGNDILFLVYFLTCPLRFSMRFVVYTIFLISTGNSRNVVRLSQLFSHPFMAYGYLSFHFLERSFRAILAASSFEALYIGFISLLKSLLSFQATYLQAFLI